MLNHENDGILQLLIYTDSFENTEFTRKEVFKGQIVSFTNN